MNEQVASYRRIDKCRVSGSENLISVLNLGHSELTGVFPRSADTVVTRGPLELVWCPDSGLLQLAHTYDAGEMYGENYGYRSGLNRSMIDHLTRKIRHLERAANLRPGDTVLDIGSNDATSLKAYTTQGVTRIGIDPTAAKFRAHYPTDVLFAPEFFSASTYWSMASKPAQIVTSIAMFYDLDSPISFAREIVEVLADDGIWHFEQSYMPSMLRLCSYDTICHEHLEYYSLSVVRLILEAVDMKLVDVRMNAINGGSFAVTAAKKSSSLSPNSVLIEWLLEQEDRMGLHAPGPYRDFENRVFTHRGDLRRLIEKLVSCKKKVFGYGASTKGNVILQTCGLSKDHIGAIAEVNPEKFGAFTPGTHIPILSEEEVRKMKPDYLLVLPWHFKDGIVAREQEFLNAGGKLIIPFPEIEIV
jgi:hypothetical protein